MTEARDVIDAVPITVMDNMGGYYESTIGEQLGADAIITALRDAGFAVVKKEPTREMLAAGATSLVNDQDHRGIHQLAVSPAYGAYKAMLKAAQGGVE